MEDFDVLLNRVSELRKQNKEKDKFNVFRSLGFSSQETMHSKFISTLLDPKDQHGKKKSFLNLFLNRINSDFNIENVTIKTEKSVHKRRIDISIENSDSVIIIENKIFAFDQEQQLEDYYNFYKEDKNVELIYLTLHGNPPSDRSLGETLLKERDKIKCISYEKTIIPWITECAIQSEGRLKASLEMYNELLHVLINRNNYMNEIFKYLKDDKKQLKVAIDINSALAGRHYLDEFPEAKEYLIKRIYATLDEANPYYNDVDKKTTLNITDEGDIANWCFYFNDGVVYVQNDNNDSQCINLFSPYDINDKKLRSLIFEEDDIVDEWLLNLFEQIRRMK